MRPQREKIRLPVALVKTAFDQLDGTPFDQLVYPGWWLAEATPSMYHRELPPETLWDWRRLPT